MNLFKNLSSAIRKLSVLLVIMALVSFFLFLYYYKYVPANRERLQHQAFLILNQNEQGLSQSISDIENYFRTLRKEAVEDRDLEKDSIVRWRPFKYTRKLVHHNGDSNNAKTDSAKARIKVCLKSGGIVYYFPGYNTDFKYIVSIESINKNILDNGKKEFFDSYFILGSDTSDFKTSNPSKDQNEKKELVFGPDHVIYHSPTLSMFSEIPHDSMGRVLSVSEFQKIVDLNIGGIPYKVFLQPFQLKTNQGHISMLLAGLMRVSNYNDRLENIPYGPVSTIIILFLLVLIAMPYTKVFFISPEEKFGIRDVISLGCTMMIGSAVLLIILQQLIMNGSASYRVKNDLNYLGEKINSKFTEEIKRACHFLNYWDLSLKQNLRDSPIRTGNSNFEDTHFKIREKNGYRNLPFPDSNSDYLYFTGIQWDNDSGVQHHKGSLTDSRITLINVGQRQYFKDVKEGRLFSYRDEPGYAFSWQSVYSMSNGAFEADISMPSRIDTMGIRAVAMSTQLESVINTILPSGYGFYIIDQNGFIQFQSNGAVTLKENFMDWVNEKENFENTLISRQTRYIPEQTINNKRYSLEIRPLNELPFYLIVYHCKDDTTASVLHVSSISVFFAFLYFPIIFLFCFVAWKQTNFFSFLYQPVFQYNWLKPGKDKSDFFTVAIIFLFFYLLIAFLFVLLNPHKILIWFIGFLFPVFALWILYLLFRQLYLSKLDPNAQHINLASSIKSLIRLYNIVPLITIVVLLFVYMNVDKATTDHSVYLWVFVAISIAMIPFMTWVVPKKLENKLSKGSLINRSWYTPLNLYSLFWFISVVSISFFPIHCFFIYAQEREIAAITRTEQLKMAMAIENRIPKLNWFHEVLKNRSLPEKVRDSALFKCGIYQTGDTNAIRYYYDNRVKNYGSEGDQAETYDQILRAVSWNYHSLDKSLTTQKQAGDGKWNWVESLDAEGRIADLNFAVETGTNDRGTLTRVKEISLQNRIPTIGSYSQLNTWRGVTFILLVSLVLLSLFFIIFRNITHRIFLLGFQKNIPKVKSKDENLVYKKINSDNLPFRLALERVLKQGNPGTSNADIIAYLEKEWKKEHICLSKSVAEIRNLEGQILFNQEIFEKVYKILWDSCKKREKYFLYNMSQDGFINYKNSTLIHKLMNKGLLTIDDNDGLNIFSVSFRNFILDKRNSKEMISLLDQYHLKGSWNSIRTPVLITITAFGTFLFITQEDLIQRVAALVPTISAIFGLGAMIFGSKSQSAAAK